MPQPDQDLPNILKHPEALCNTIRRLALEAGEITLDYFEGLLDMEVDSKDDSSPVTVADRKAEALITKQLEQITPGIPVIGEEAVAEGKAPALKEAPYFWLVDPLDGTKEFISGSGEYTVNIALIHNAQPVLGVVHAPALETLYAGYVFPNDQRKAVRWSEESDHDKPIHIREIPASGMVVVASKSHGDLTRLDQFLDNFKIAKMVKKGSSLKMCAIAEGKADIYPRFGPTCEWDTAAAHAILRAAGGEIYDTNGVPLTYGGTNPKFLNPEFIASSFDWHSSLQEE